MYFKETKYAKTQLIPKVALILNSVLGLVRHLYVDGKVFYVRNVASHRHSVETQIILMGL